jgi:hypothetical protein
MWRAAPPPTHTLNAQQGAAAAFQVDQHLLPKGVMGPNLRHVRVGASRLARVCSVVWWVGVGVGIGG